ncbi:sodium transporter HKT1-like isoform X2 [Vicia villosa]|uniref:sodium transporter HKT1-like isoform X2 n=1 Tax=Vicia villosa TaxID=3911 RepID=UPI00273CE698|nr:sodium transporter HKT1-like isoform X2 [Vicia villosa]
MKNNFAKNSQHLYTFFPSKFHFNNFFIQLFYFIILSLFGYLGLKFSIPRSSTKPNDLDLFYTSVSASTVSSMTSIEMEVFSNSQLILLTFLMLVGGEVFTSMLQLFLDRFFHFTQNHSLKNESPPININQIELGLVSIPQSENHTQSNNNNNINNKDKIKYNSLRYLSYVVLSYLMIVQFFGFSLVTLYLTYIPSAKHVLENKGIKIETFSLFTIVSTFASCGYVPTNENMIVFKKNSGLLLLILPHILLGNTLYPSCLRLFITLLKKVTKREEFSYLLKNSKEMGYDHLLSRTHCWNLVLTVFGFNIIQFVLFCSMEWSSEIMEGLNLYQKVVASLFQVTNARHSGESVFDLSTISSAILVLFIVMIAYGNVGFSTGYSCSRQLKPDSMCKDSWIGFSGRWSTKGKFILILVMFFGRLKKFNMNGGKAWHLS